MTGINAAYQEVEQSGPRCWTHPLVLLPAMSLLFFICGLVVSGCCGDFVCTCCAVLSYLVALGGVSFLGTTWILGHRSPKAYSGGSEEVTLYQTDVLRLDSGSEILMSHAPGRRTRRSFRSLSADVSQLKHHYGVDIVVTLLSSNELEAMSCQNLRACVEEEGMVWMYLDLRDKWIPWNSQEYLSRVVLPVKRHLCARSRVLVHCNGGKGRTGMLVAALLMTSVGGHQSLQGAISSMRRVRPGMLRNPLQQLFLLHLRDTLRQL